jgi:hypothetical protein
MPRGSTRGCRPPAARAAADSVVLPAVHKLLARPHRAAAAHRPGFGLLAAAGTRSGCGSRCLGVAVHAGDYNVLLEAVRISYRLRREPGAGGVMWSHHRHSRDPCAALAGPPPSPAIGCADAAREAVGGRGTPRLSEPTCGSCLSFAAAPRSSNTPCTRGGATCGGTLIMRSFTSSAVPGASQACGCRGERLGQEWGRRADGSGERRAATSGTRIRRRRWRSGGCRCQGPAL